MQRRTLPLQVHALFCNQFVDKDNTSITRDIVISELQLKVLNVFDMVEGTRKELVAST